MNDSVFGRARADRERLAAEREALRRRLGEVDGDIASLDAFLDVARRYAVAPDPPGAFSEAAAPPPPPRVPDDAGSPGEGLLDSGLPPRRKYSKSDPHRAQREAKALELLTVPGQRQGFRAIGRAVGLDRSVVLAIAKAHGYRPPPEVAARMERMRSTLPWAAARAVPTGRDGAR